MPDRDSVVVRLNDENLDGDLAGTFRHIMKAVADMVEGQLISTETVMGGLLCVFFRVDPAFLRETAKQHIDAQMGTRRGKVYTFLAGVPLKDDPETNALVQEEVRRLAEEQILDSFHHQIKTQLNSLGAQGLFTVFSRDEEIKNSRPSPHSPS